ncbi:MAG: LysR family transcriptional regulator [Lachnospiraceae bacterium]|nr:LysR family transcriptional regulator [Lachnospiraceae bacterium]MDE7434764.1 LysR family transcriptional regulator [Lachnospiraceae bacterium]
MDINYELYKVFYYVATSLSFSEASKKLYISQSAVSQSVKTLERKLEQSLFIRSTKKVQLTQAGEMLLRHIEPAMNLIARGEKQLLSANTPGLGQLHIGASDTICRYFLVPYLKQFHQQFPDVSIKVTNATSLGCVELLEQGRVDLVVTNTPNERLNPEHIRKRLLRFSDVFIANPAYFDLTGKTVSLSELTSYPLLMLDHKSTTSAFIHSLFLQHQLELIPEVELSSNDLLMDLARIGLGIACIPDYCLSDQATDLVVLHTKERIRPRHLAAAVNPSFPPAPSTEAFLELLPELI